MLSEEFDDTKGVIRICKSTKDKKIKYRATRIPLKTSDEPRCSRRKAVPAPHVAPVVLFLLEILHQPIKAYI